MKDSYRLHHRFDRMGRLVGDDNMKTLMHSSVLVIGLGGVGSWAAEAIVRSGVGRVELVDFDDVCITNSNRQLQATEDTIGQPKAEILARRLRSINPDAEILSHIKFFSEETADEILHGAQGRTPDFVVDAIDNVTAKCHLLHRCKKDGIPVVCSTGAGGRMDPTRVQVHDLSQTTIDPLAKTVRSVLRKQYSFPGHGPFGIPAVYSVEKARDPVDLHYDEGKGFRCLCPHGGKNPEHSCDKRRLILGTAPFVTATFGMICASVAVSGLLKNR